MGELWGPAQDSHIWSVDKIDVGCLSYFLPDIGLFGTDVFTDYWNGGNLIASGDVIWGGIIVSLTFLPMTIILLFLAFAWLAKKEDRWAGALLLLLLPLATAIATPTYMIFIIVAGFAKLYKPVIKDEDELLCGWLSGENVNIFAPIFRMLELVGESYPQALLGELALVLLYLIMMPLQRQCYSIFFILQNTTRDQSTIFNLNLNLLPQDYLFKLCSSRARM